MEIKKFYTCQKRMETIYDLKGRKDGLQADTPQDFKSWKLKSRQMLWEMLGLDRMESCPLLPQVLEVVWIEAGIRREKILIQVEPEVYMPMYILIPDSEGEGSKPKCVLAPPGHQGAGKYAVAGCSEIPEVREMIRFYNYDYGLQLARLGYVALCPDSRGFGERREAALQGDSREAFLNSTCFHLAHMAEPLGMTVAGMCTWDLMRLIDYIVERDEWDVDHIGCLGFSGGGMQTLWLAAMDERIRFGVVSGYMYGYKDSLLKLNGNCSCNYVPRLWEHMDMGDIGALIAPRPLMVQSCREDHLNGERGMDNVLEQMAIIQKAYDLNSAGMNLHHDICPGGHRWHDEKLADFLVRAAEVEQ